MDSLKIEMNKASKEKLITHKESLNFVNRNRDILENYAKGRVNIEQAPDGLNTFAFNLENNTIYVNDMFYKDFNFSEEKTTFAVLHEIEHFMEKKQILDEDGGEKVFIKYLEKNKKSKAYGVMDNCIADIRENRTVVSRTNEGMGDLEKKIYKENLFKETDFTSQPKHLQFPQAILREARVEGEKCLVNDDVRFEIENLNKVKGLIDILTHPDTPMSIRLKLQDKYIWPVVEKLLKKDLEKKENNQNQKKDQNNQNKDGGEGESENVGEDDENESENKENKENKGNKENAHSEAKDNKGKESRNSEKLDPNEVFKNEYEEINKKFPEAMSIEEMEKTFEKWKKNQDKNKGDKADQDYAKSIGVEKDDLQKYRKIVEELSKIKNEENNISVIEDLKNLFSRIISKRNRKILYPKYPLEEGDELVDPALLVASVKSGNLEPKVWQDLEYKEKKGEQFGEVEITLICDRSGSMTEGDGEKAVVQRKSTVLVMEALKEFSDICEEEKNNIEKTLEVSSEIYSFSSSDEDKTPIKKMSKELGEAERIKVLKKLYNLPGSTTDFVCLESIYSSLDEDKEKKIKGGELKKIVIVMTDGGSDDSNRVQNVLKGLKDKGLVVIGVGMTQSGEPVLETYKPDALVVENIKDLPIVLANLLKEHLKDI